MGQWQRRLGAAAAHVSASTRDSVAYGLATPTWGAPDVSQLRECQPPKFVALLQNLLLWNGSALRAVIPCSSVPVVRRAVAVFGAASWL
jgi:hypothetical protein